MIFCPRQIDHQRCPFEYFVYDRLFSERAAGAILRWMSVTTSWRLVETDFYEQFEFRFDTIKLPEPLKFLNSSDFRSQMSEFMSNNFRTDLNEQCQLVAHKLLPGQHIGIHNDVVNGEETHRLTVQFNSGMREDDGGYFMLFNSSNSDDIHRILKPANNSAIAFKISERSHHAVSRVHDGVRHSIVFSFRER